MPLGTGLDKLLGKLPLVKDGKGISSTERTRSLSRSSLVDCRNVGADVLQRYQKQWEEIHDRTIECSLLSNTVDELTSPIFQRINQREEALKRLNALLTSIPSLEQDIDKVEDDLKNTFQSLSRLEEVIDRRTEVKFDEDIRRKFDVQYAVSIHSKRLNREFDKNSRLLEVEHSKRLIELKKREEMKILEKQKKLQEAFDREVKQYKTSGKIAKSPQMAAPSLPLEQVEVPQDEADREQLEKFLAEESYEALP